MDLFFRHVISKTVYCSSIVDTGWLVVRYTGGSALICNEGDSQDLPLN